MLNEIVRERVIFNVLLSIFIICSAIVIFYDKITGMFRRTGGDKH